MKYLIIGLGNFGSTLAEELTTLGHEVIGVDTDESRADAIKERISVAYIMDASEPHSLASLPLVEIDCAIVTIGKSMDASLRVVAMLKELAVKNIYARALDNIHKSILGAMNIQKIFIPETYAARIFAEKFSTENTAELV